MAFPKIYTLFYCPEILERDKDVMESRALVFDVEDCYVLISSGIRYHKEYGLYFIEDPDSFKTEIAYDTQHFIGDDRPMSFDPNDIDELVYRIELFLVDAHSDMLKELQVTDYYQSPESMQKRIRLILIQLQHHRENYEANGFEHAPKGTTIWSDRGYSVKAGIHYTVRQRLLWSLYDEDKTTYSYENFKSYCWFCRRKAGSNTSQRGAIHRREQDKMALFNYVETGSKEYVPD
jgi:hypothetical protein